MVKQNLIGKRIGNLVVEGPAQSRTQPCGISCTFWLCRCDCGKAVEARTASLNRGQPKSCGCRSRDWHRKNKGKLSPNWKGGVIKDDYGYVLIRKPKHHRSKSNGYVREHIVVMEKVLGRRLKKGETVHHKNGIRNDNRPENLELWTKSHPPGQRVSDIVCWAKRILELYDK